MLNGFNRNCSAGPRVRLIVRQKRKKAFFPMNSDNGMSCGPVAARPSTGQGQKYVLMSRGPKVTEWILLFEPKADMWLSETQEGRRWSNSDKTMLFCDCEHWIRKIIWCKTYFCCPLEAAGFITSWYFWPMRQKFWELFSWGWTSKLNLNEMNNISLSLVVISLV